MIKFLTVVSIVTLLWPCCLAGDDALQAAILLFPKAKASDYHPDTAVNAVNILIQAGESAACDALRKFVQSAGGTENADKFNEKVCLMCRLLFIATNTAEALRGPKLGGSGILPYDNMGSADWPYLPFAIVNEVPLSMTTGFTMQGIPENCGEYLTYCQANGAFRTRPYPTPNFVTVSNALADLFQSPAWKKLKWEASGATWHYRLNEEYAKERLLEQLANVKYP